MDAKHYKLLSTVGHSIMGLVGMVSAFIIVIYTLFYGDVPQFFIVISIYIIFFLISFACAYGLWENKVWGYVCSVILNTVFILSAYFAYFYYIKSIIYILIISYNVFLLFILFKLWYSAYSASCKYWFRKLEEYVKTIPAAYSTITILIILSAYYLSTFPLYISPVGLPDSHISDSKLLEYASSPISTPIENLFNVTRVGIWDLNIGSHNGIPVLVEFICSDVCPDYTIRIIRYDIDKLYCKTAGGELIKVTVPEGIWIASREYCFPKILVANAPLTKGYTEEELNVW